MGPRGWTLSRGRLGVDDVRDRFPFRATVLQVHADQLWIYHRLFCVDRTCVGNLEVTPWERKHPESSDYSLTRSLPLPVLTPSPACGPLFRRLWLTQQ